MVAESVSRVDGDRLAELRSLGSGRTFASGEAIVTEGSESDAVFLITHGEVAVTARASDGKAVPLAALGPGDLVGEITTVAGGMRTATVTAVGAVEAVAIERHEFESWLDRHPEAAEAIIDQARRRIDERMLTTLLAPLFGVDREVSSHVAASAEWVHVEAGHTLYEEGDHDDGAYLIVSGRLLVLAGSDVSPIELGRGELVGELGVADDVIRSATAVALRDSTLARFSRDAFEGLMTEHPQLAVRVARILVSRAVGSLPRAPRAASIGIAVTAEGIDRRLVTSRLVEELNRHGTTIHLWRARIDSLLNRGGIADTGPDDPGVPRLDEFLHEVELDHDHVVLEADPGAHQWTRRVLRTADRVMIVMSATPSEGEDRTVARLVADMPETRHTPVWLVLVHEPGSEGLMGSAAIRARYGADELFHLRTGHAEDFARLARLMAGRGIGLVLGGGGARGFAHIGVVRAMNELGIPIDSVGGASIGAPIGGGVALGVPEEDQVEVVQKLFSRLFDYTIPAVSLVKGERITNSINEAFGEREFEDLILPFFCVSTNLTRSRLEVHRRGRVAEAVRASVAIPGVLPPVPRDDDLLVDAGLLNNLPADEMGKLGSIGTVIAVDVAPALGPRARSDFGLSVSGWTALRSRVGKGKPEYPGITSILLRSLMVASARDRNRIARTGDIDLLLDLDLRGVGLLEFDRVAEVAAAGYEAAIPRFEQWLMARESVS